VNFEPVFFYCFGCLAKQLDAYAGKQIVIGEIIHLDVGVHFQLCWKD
jgi:hypothetical protein